MAASNCRDRFSTIPRCLPTATNIVLETRLFLAIVSPTHAALARMRILTAATKKKKKPFGDYVLCDSRASLKTRKQNNADRLAEERLHKNVLRTMRPPPGRRGPREPTLFSTSSWTSRSARAYLIFHILLDVAVRASLTLFSTSSWTSRSARASSFLRRTGLLARSSYFKPAEASSFMIFWEERV